MYVCGSGECEQLGLGDGVLEKKKPAVVRSLQQKQVRRRWFFSSPSRTSSAAVALSFWIDVAVFSQRPDRSDPAAFHCPLRRTQLSARCGGCRCRLWGLAHDRDDRGRQAVHLIEIKVTHRWLFLVR